MFNSERSPEGALWLLGGGKPKPVIKLGKDIISKQLVDKGKPHYIFFIGGRKEIETETTIYKIPSEVQLPGKSLGFIRKVKEYILVHNRDQSDQITPPGQNRFINYYYNLMAFQSYGHFENVYELDIKSAFWQIAYRQGYINKALYIEGYKHKKKTRLIALGSLARESFRITFDGKDYVEKSDLEFNRLGKRIFNQIAFTVDNLFDDLVHDRKLLLYWVDAAFCTKGNLPYIYNFFKDKGLPFRIRHIKGMCFQDIKKGTQRIYVTSDINRHLLFTTYKTRIFDVGRKPNKITKYVQKNLSIK